MVKSLKTPPPSPPPPPQQQHLPQQPVKIYKESTDRIERLIFINMIDITEWENYKPAQTHTHTHKKIESKETQKEKEIEIEIDR